jgi:hypothetical protein
MPNINGATEREMLAQIRSYLYQLVPQLQWSLNNLDTASSSSHVTQQIIKETGSGKAKESPEATFNEIKALIIKSADIVEAYYDEINSRLEGVYVSESDFGTYAEMTSQNIRQTSTYIEQLFADLQVIDTNIESITHALIDVNAHIKTGLLDYDKETGTPIFGLEIGQRNEVDGEEVFNKFARFTADRLSFYDQNDNEVAYVSDYKLYIRNVEITSSYKIGGFVDTVMQNGDVVTKWVGGEG